MGEELLDIMNLKNKEDTPDHGRVEDMKAETAVLVDEEL